MENNAVSQQWKLIFQKINLGKLIIIAFGILIVGLLINFNDYPCSPYRILLTYEVFQYEGSPDPESCESLVEKINSYNETCESKIEILDCG